MASSVKITKDALPELLRAIKRLTAQEVLVGIPDKNADRPADPDDPSPPTNATLGYIHEFGVPEQNIPARPFLMPGIAAASDDIIKRMRDGGKAVLRGQPDAVEKAMSKVGLAASNSVKEKITDGPFAPLSLRTIEARANRGGKGKGRKGARQYVKLMEEGVPLDVLNGADLVRPLIDTGKLRQSITYVVRKKGQK